MSELNERLAQAACGSGGVTESATGERRSWESIRERAGSLAPRLQAASSEGVVGLLGDPDHELVELIYACTMANIRFSVLQPAARGENVQTYLRRLRQDSQRASCSLVVATTAVDRELLNQDVAQVCRAHDLPSSRRPTNGIRSDDTDVLVSHFSSGTTGTAHCVGLTHRNVLAGCQATMTASDHDRIHDVLLSWLPLSHDMGLFGFLFVAMLCGDCELVLSGPGRFVAEPRTWFEDVAKYHATTIAAPNFAYALAARLLRTCASPSLESVKCCLSGGERVTYDAMEGFSRAAGSFGLQPNSLVVAYGLAEATLAVSMTTLGSPLEYESRNVNDIKVAVASCGYPVPGMEITTKLAGVDGEIRVRGESVARDALSADGWLHTGDIGAVRDEKLYVSGRAKNVIIRGGVNLYPEDIEFEAAKVDGVRPGAVAALGRTTVAGTETVVIFVESDATASETANLATIIRMRVTEALNISVSDVVFLPRGSLPKTSSGKLQHGVVAERYLQTGLHTA